MDIRVSGHQIETGEALQAHAQDRLIRDRRQVLSQGDLQFRHLRQSRSGKRRFAAISSPT
jgi:ribosome-associated translation inhibitor RaiA